MTKNAYFSMKISTPAAIARIAMIIPVWATGIDMNCSNPVITNHAASNVIPNLLLCLKHITSLRCC
jgi:hypothetical protein